MKDRVKEILIKKELKEEINKRTQRSIVVMKKKRKGREKNKIKKGK